LHQKTAQIIQVQIAVLLAQIAQTELQQASSAADMATVMGSTQASTSFGLSPSATLWASMSISLFSLRARACQASR
jgi:hypothetical protein